MAQSHSLRIFPNFERVHEPLAKLGVDTALVYAKAGINRRDLELDSVGLIHYLRVLQVGAELSRKPFLGLEIAQMRQAADLGLYGYMIANASDYRELLQLANKYLDVVTPGAVGSLTETGSHALWTYEFPGLDAELCRQEVELSLMEFVWFTRTAIGQAEWRPAEVCFQHDAPEDPAPLQQAMTPNIAFNHWFNGAVFPRRLLDQRISGADTRLLRLLQDQVEELHSQLQVSQDLLAKVSLMIASGIGKSDISSESLAHGLHMSRRSLHRRLAEAGTSVQAMRDAVVIRLAKQMLLTTRAPISEVASMLGYSESSAFMRAFSRLTGETPTVFRKRHDSVSE